MCIARPHCGHENEAAVIDGNNCTRLLMCCLLPRSGQRISRIAPADGRSQQAALRRQLSGTIALVSWSLLASA